LEELIAKIRGGWAESGSIRPLNSHSCLSHNSTSSVRYVLTLK